MFPLPHRKPFHPGFTLVELMIAMSIMVIILLLVTSIINSSSDIWRRSSEKVEAFQAARSGFDLITRNLSQTTLNTYYDYDSPTAPTRYLRNSELQFSIQLAGSAGGGGANLPGTVGTGQIVMFQAPLSSAAVSYTGLPSLLNSCGYYVEFGNQKGRPGFVAAPNRYRYRLMQLLIPAENNQIYTDPSVATGPSQFKWFTNFVPTAQPVAENIVALILLPKDPDPAASPLTSDYTYDSRFNWKATPQPITANQLPPVIQVAMIAITEKSALRMENGTGEPGVIKSALLGKFKNTQDYNKDLADVQTALNAAKPPIEYRVFTSSIPMRETKWTKL